MVAAVPPLSRHAPPAPGLAVASKEVTEAVEALAEGRLIVLMDTASGTTAGYVVAAAARVTPELVTVMLREGRPLLVLTDDRCRALDLRRPAYDNPLMSQYLESIEARDGVTTGVSAADQARTIRTAVDPGSGPRDIVRPGHIVSVRASPGGILQRLGVYEAAVDLAELAGHPGGAVMCVLLDEAGDVLSTPSLISAWAAERSVPMVTTMDALDARLAADRFVSREVDDQVETAHGPVRTVTFVDLHAGVHHYAITAGDITADEPVALDVLEQDVLADVFRHDRRHLLDPLAALRSEPPGVVLYIASPALPGARSADPSEIARASLLAAKRQAHVSSQMLQALGVRTVRRPRR
jgi:3,4-dihydroxy 2-butanone 4-phosphate synthase/GTP cyclohydrolase II